jgi:hypothetical protein
MIMEITRNPLCWPNNVSRTAPHLRGNPQFKERSLYESSRYVLEEINRLNERRWDHADESVIISSNLRLKQDGTPFSNQVEPSDSGVAVYFQLRFLRNGKWYEFPIVLSCDKWRKTADNLYAIGKDIDAQRSRQRWGCTKLEQSFRGYLAIPEKCGGASWWVLLGVDSTATEQQVKDAFRALSKKLHPDMIRNVTAADREKWNLLCEAYDQALGVFRV